MRTLFVAAALATCISGSVLAEDIYLPRELQEELEYFSQRPGGNHGGMEIIGDRGQISITFPQVTADAATPWIGDGFGMSYYLPEPRDGFIACINGRAMFREDGKRRFLNQPQAAQYCG